MKFNRVFVRGDTHGDFTWLRDWCETNSTTTDDALIILGDAGILYYGANNWRETNMKKQIAACPITLLCVRGNHEDRAADRPNMLSVVENDDPIVPGGYFYEAAYPNIWHIMDGSMLDINSKRCLFIGGAYSVDQEYRFLMGWKWVENEELSEDEMCDILDLLSGSGQHYHFDFVFTHTCPEPVIPTDLFLSGIDQSRVSRAMESFLETVSHVIYFDKWYFGHYHANRHIDNKFTILFQETEEIM